MATLLPITETISDECWFYKHNFFCPYRVYNRSKFPYLQSVMHWVDH